MIRFVILAAGASTRMGTPKPALPLGVGGETFLSRIVESAITAGFEDIVIVSGAHAQAVEAALPKRDPRVRIAYNAEWSKGQLSSLVVGLEVPSSTPLDAIAMTLVDVPLVTADTMVVLVRAWHESGAPIVRPARGDEHGHPVIFSAALFDELRRADPARGAKSVVRAHANEIVNVPIDDPGAYLDVDTPETYARIMADM
jgi:molybdenum cofactor cytidylyltransferase